KTLEMEAGANGYIDRIDKLGGMIFAIEAGVPQRELAAASFRYQREIEQGERVIVGVNRFPSDDQPIEVLQIDQTAQARQEEKRAKLRQPREKSAVQGALDTLSKAAEGQE